MSAGQVTGSPRKRFAVGAYKFLRIVDGSDMNSGINFGEEPTVLRITLDTY
jgi:hypothetical protein